MNCRPAIAATAAARIIPGDIPAEEIRPFGHKA